MKTNRRQFIKLAGTGIATAYFAPSLLSCSNTVSIGLAEIGLQLYTLREQLIHDATGTLVRVANIGYDHVETFGAEIQADGKSSFWGLETGTLRRILDDNGLKTLSGHYLLDDFLTRGIGDEDVLKICVDIALELGQQYIIVPVPPLSLIDRLGADDYRFMADQLNIGGEMVAKAGLKLGYHNHFWEFRSLDNGLTGMDILIDRTETDLVAFELDLFWTEKAGIDSAAFIRKHPSRFPLWHIKDMNKQDTAPVIGPEYDNRPALEIAMGITYTEVGTGSIDFHKIIAEKQAAGLQLAYVEQDIISIDPFDSITESLNYVKSKLLAK